VSIDRVCTLLRSLTGEQPVLPPSELYCEGWLLRIILDWYSSQKVSGDPLAFPERGRWFSEARLPSTFRPRKRGDLLGEARSRADGVIGHLVIGGSTKAGLRLAPDATCFIVIEAKMSSGLSPRVTHMAGFDQAARSIACIAEVLRRAERPAASLARLAFYVVAPRTQVSKGKFAKLLDRTRVNETVQARVQNYQGEQDQWYAEWFRPTLERIEVDAIAWEDVIGSIAQQDGLSGAELRAFYDLCLTYNA
jgi:hypothetical protein